MSWEITEKLITRKIPAQQMLYIDEAVKCRKGQNKFCIHRHSLSTYSMNIEEVKDELSMEE